MLIGTQGDKKSMGIGNGCFHLQTSDQTQVGHNLVQKASKFLEADSPISTAQNVVLSNRGFVCDTV